MFFQSEGTRAERLERGDEGVRRRRRAVGELVAFIRESGNRPLALPRKNGDNGADDDYDGR